MDDAKISIYFGNSLVEQTSKLSLHNLKEFAKVKSSIFKYLQDHFINELGFDNSFILDEKNFDNYFLLRREDDAEYKEFLLHNLKECEFISTNLKHDLDISIVDVFERREFFSKMTLQNLDGFYFVSHCVA